MPLAANILHRFGPIGVQAIVNDLRQVNATGKTIKSVTYKVESDSTSDTLKILGRDFFSALESGRGPRKSTTKGDFEDNMLEYIKARGIGSDLTEKKRKQLARFLTLKINREGDRTFKAGGRIIYTPTLERLVKEITETVTKEAIGYYISEVKSV